MIKAGPIGSRLLPCILAVSLAGCTSLRYFLANAPTAVGSYERRTDLPYGTEPRQTLDVYLPKTGTNRPIVVFWHGGSWQQGNKKQYRFVGAALAERGFIAVLPDYRVYPDVRFPEFMRDGAAAIAWIENHTQQLGGDPDRVVLMGHSAGAHLAALLALNNQYLVHAGVAPEHIVGLIGLSGPYALDPDTAALRAIFSSPFTLADWRPVRFVTSQSPPTLLLQGLDDTIVSPQHAEQLRDALQRHDVPVETHFYPNRGHADTIASLSLLGRGRTPALRQVVSFLHRVTEHRRNSHASEK